MKAIEALKQINAIFSEYVAIAKDENGVVYVYSSKKLSCNDGFWDINSGLFGTSCHFVSQEFSSKIEWHSDDLTKCIVTINDLQNEEL